MSPRGAVLLIVFILANSAESQRVEGEWHFGPSGRTVEERLPRHLEVRDKTPAIFISAASDEANKELEILRAWNAAGNRPVMNGFVHDVEAIQFQMDGTGAWEGSGGFEPSFSGRSFWFADLFVEQAHGFRVKLEDVDLPKEANLWTIDGVSVAGPFDVASLTHDATMWTPKILGEKGRVVVSIPFGTVGAGFRIDELMEIVAPDERRELGASDYTDCAINGECVGNGDFEGINMARAAVALLEFVDGRNSYICTGGLLADTDPATTIPYLLTANHCFDTQASASTLEAWFDYRWDDCAKSGFDAGQRTVGAKMLQSSASSDFTLVQLTGTIPAGRAYLGWDASPSIGGTTKLHRVSHPAGDPQSYSRSFVNEISGTCSGVPRSRFIYATVDSGATAGGSSGSPLLLDGAIVVGQLFGACGFEGSDDCDYSSYDEVDGRFSETFPLIDEWLDPPRCEEATITAQPSNRVVDYNEGTTLSANASGSEPIAWRWYVGNSGETDEPVSGATSRTLSTPDLRVTTRFWARATNECGVADSEAAIVTVEDCVAASISSEPAPRSIEFGDRATLTVGARGSRHLAYQWYRGDSGDTARRISGATSSSYRTPSLSQSEMYWVRVENDCGTRDSESVLVTVLCELPVLEFDDSPIEIIRGGRAVLTVFASGVEPLSYQWFAGDEAIEGATEPVLTTPPNDRSTTYRVVVKNPCGASAAEFEIKVPLLRRRGARRP